MFIFEMILKVEQGSGAFTELSLVGEAQNAGCASAESCQDRLLLAEAFPLLRFAFLASDLQHVAGLTTANHHKSEFVENGFMTGAPCKRVMLFR